MTKPTLQRRSKSNVVPSPKPVPVPHRMPSPVAVVVIEPREADAPVVMTGPELIDEIGKEPTLDRLMRRDNRSKPAKDEELMTLVNSLRRDRATMILKDEKRSAKKQGVEDATEENDDPVSE